MKAELILLAEQLGWVLLNTLWQGALIAAALALVLRWVHSSAVRHFLCMAAMTAMLITCVGTYFSISHSDSVSVSLPTYAMPMDVEDSATNPGANSAESVAARVPIDTTSTDAQSAGSVVEKIRPAFDPASLLVIASGIWIIGFLLCLLRRFLGFRKLQKWRSAARRSLPPNLEEAAIQVRDKIAGAERVAIRICDEVAAPVILGLVKPVIFVPMSIATALSADQLELILTHELAHWRRCDTWFHTWQLVLDSIFFYHPAYRWMSRAANRAREEAADDFVLISGASKTDYARVLTELAARQLEPVPEACLAASGSHVAHRIRRFISHSEKMNPGPSRGECGILGAIAFTVAVIGTGIHSSAQAKSDKNKPIPQKYINGVIANVNGLPITQVDLNEAVRTQVQQYLQKTGGQITASEAEKEIRTMEKNALDQLIERKLMLSEFKASQAQILEKYIDEEIDRFIKGRFAGDREEFTKKLADQKLSLSDFRKVQADQIAVQAMKSRWTKNQDKAPLRPEQREGIIQDFIQEIEEQNAKKSKAKIRMISIPKMTAERTWEQQVELVQSLRDRIVKGESFGEIAKQYSKDSFSSKGGEVGVVKRHGQLNPNLSRVTFELEPETISEPFDDRSSWRLIRVEELIKPPTPGREQLADEIEEQLRVKKKHAILKTELDKLRKKASIERFTPSLNPLKDRDKKSAQFPIKSIEVQYVGKPQVIEKQILAEIRAKVGEPLSDAQLDSDIKAIAALPSVDRVCVVSKELAEEIGLVIVVECSTEGSSLIKNTSKARYQSWNELIVSGETVADQIVSDMKAQELAHKKKVEEARRRHEAEVQKAGFDAKIREVLKEVIREQNLSSK